MARGVNKHAVTHRSRGLGGTDPVPPDLPMVYGYVASQSVTANEEAEFTQVSTSDPDTFRWDPSDPAGLLIQRDGEYLFMATMDNSTANVLRAFGIATGSYSGGPFAGTFISDLSNRFTSGFRQVTAASHTAFPTVTLWEMSQRAYFLGDVTDPIRAAVVIDHQGTNFTAAVSFRIVKLTNAGFMVQPPMPES